MEKSNERHIILGALLVVLVLVGGYTWFKTHRAPESITPHAANGVAVTNSLPDQDSDVKALPAGFPEDMPVELANLTESYQAVYSDKRVTQSTAAYTSDKSKDTLWTLYSNYLDEQKFEIDQNATNKTAGRLVGTRLRETLTVVISSQGDVRFVQLNLIHR